jgi:hypothetical protein
MAEVAQHQDSMEPSDEAVNIIDRQAGRQVGLAFVKKEDSGRSCLPSMSKLEASSQAIYTPWIGGHSSSVIEYQAVSRLHPLQWFALRKTPSNVKPKRTPRPT